MSCTSAVVKSKNILVKYFGKVFSSIKKRDDKLLFLNNLGTHRTILTVNRRDGCNVVWKNIKLRQRSYKKI